MADPITPPDFETNDNDLRSKIELIIYSYKLRCAITVFRKKYDIKNGSMVRFIMRYEKIGQAVHDDILAMLKLFNPELPSSFYSFMYEYAVHGRINTLPSLYVEPPVLSKIFGSSDDPRKRYFEYLATIRSMNPPSVSPYHIEIIRNSELAFEMKLVVYNKLSDSEQKQIAALIRRSTKNLPDLKRSSAAIKIFSQIADMRRSGKYKTDREIAAKVADGKYNERSIAGFYKRAIELGL